MTTQADVRVDGNRATIEDPVFFDVRVLGSNHFYIWQTTEAGEQQINLTPEGAITLADTLYLLARDFLGDDFPKARKP